MEIIKIRKTNVDTYQRVQLRPISDPNCMRVDAEVKLFNLPLIRGTLTTLNKHECVRKITSIQFLLDYR